MSQPLSTTLAHHTYMRVGGDADQIVIADTIEDLVNHAIRCRKNRQRYLVLGSGSNTLFTDKGYRGTIILNRATKIDFSNKNTVTAESGCPINFLVNSATAKGLSGLEPFLGLPGTVGGAVYNNSHYKNHLISQVLTKVTVLNQQNLVITLPVADLDMGYDTSRFHRSSEVILSATFDLNPKPIDQIAADSLAALKSRTSSQPLSLPSCGCTFKNPPNHSAGQLIDQAGLKNTTIGGASISPVHANFIINDGSATADDIITLAKLVQTTVSQKFGITLEPEVFFINEHGERIAL